MALIRRVVSEAQRNNKTLDQELIDATCSMAAAVASEVLYRMSGKQFTGDCGPVRLRPVARPSYVDGDGAWNATGAFGYSATWGTCQWQGLGSARTSSHFGCSNPPEILLPDFPVTKIKQVTIDGEIIPPDEYELRDFKTLVRMRPSASAEPTARFGWPTCQINDLPPTELGTFEVIYYFGQDPGDAGRLAARKLAEVIALPELGDSSHYPMRMTSFSRQGVSGSVADVMDVLKRGSLGIWEVDSWILAVNPRMMRQQARVFSPDRGRGRRANPSHN